MSAVPEDDPLRSADCETINALNLFDSARNTLYDNLALRVAEQKTPEDYRAEAKVEVEQTTDAFNDLVDAISHEHEDFDTKVAELKLVWLQDEVERSKAFKELADCENDCFEEPTSKDLDETIEDILEDPSNDLLPEIKVIYRESLNSDMFMLARHLEDKHNPENIQPSRLQLLGAHAIDVSKIASGVTIGIVVAKLVSKIPL